VIGEAVILLGAPRSGTTVLFDTLGRSSHLWSLGQESHEVLEGPFHPSLRGWDSNALAAEDLDPATAEALRTQFVLRAQPGTVWRRRGERRAAGAGSSSAERLGYFGERVGAALRRRAGRIRLLEKTPKNCLRIPFLRALFPRARFVFLRRDGRPTVSSLMDGWRAGGEYGTYDPPEPLSIAGYGGRRWCFVLQPGWRDLVRAPLEEVCAAQWSSCASAVLRHLPPLRSAGVLHECTYEDLVRDPRGTLEAILRFLGIPWEDDLLPGGTLPVVNAVTPPDPEKWRRRNGEAVERILPRIAEVQTALGYPA